MRDDIEQIPELIGQLFETVRALKRLYPDRPFTPDGHLVGSIGHVVAAHTYGLALEDYAHREFDARTLEGATVEIKLTGSTSLSFASERPSPDLLIVLGLDARSGFEEIYNGPFPLDLLATKKPSTNGIRTLGVNQLRRMNPSRLEQVQPLDLLNRGFPRGSSDE
jgi:hypothetical protein